MTYSEATLPTANSKYGKLLTNYNLDDQVEYHAVSPGGNLVGCYRTKRDAWRALIEYQERRPTTPA